jgi:hypothetical protein
LEVCGTADGLLVTFGSTCLVAGNDVAVVVIQVGGRTVGVNHGKEVKEEVFGRHL